MIRLTSYGSLNRGRNTSEDSNILADNTSNKTGKSLLVFVQYVIMKSTFDGKGACNAKLKRTPKGLVRPFEPRAE